MAAASALKACVVELNQKRWTASEHSQVIGNQRHKSRRLTSHLVAVRVSRWFSLLMEKIGLAFGFAISTAVLHSA
jgi:hypothetical protein